MTVEELYAWSAYFRLKAERECGGRLSQPVYYIDYFVGLVNLTPLNQEGKPSKGLLSK